MLCVYSRMVKLNGVEKYIVKKGGSRYRWWGYVGGERGTGGGGSDENSGGSSTSQTNSKDGVGAFGGARFSVVSAAVLYGCSTFDTVFQLAVIITGYFRRLEHNRSYAARINKKSSFTLAKIDRISVQVFCLFVKSI